MLPEPENLQILYYMVNNNGNHIATAMKIFKAIAARLLFFQIEFQHTSE